MYRNQKKKLFHFLKSNRDRGRACFEAPALYPIKREIQSCVHTDPVLVENLI